VNIRVIFCGGQRDQKIERGGVVSTLSYFGLKPNASRICACDGKKKRFEAFSMYAELKKPSSFCVPLG
jgi:hypothetical protein